MTGFSERSKRSVLLVTLACLLAAGCGRPASPPDADAPVVYDFAARTAHATVLTPWRELDLASAAAEPYLLGGWGAVAADHNGTAGRWATEKRAHMLVFKTRSGDHELTFSCLPYTRSYWRQSVLVLANGRPIERVKLPRDREVSTYHVTIPDEALDAGENLLSFRFAYRSRRRQQSVQFQRLTFSGADASSTPAQPPMAADGQWSLPPHATASWHITVPRGALLRVQPFYGSGGGTCRISWRTEGRRAVLAEPDASGSEVLEIPMAAAAGKRAWVSFENRGDTPMRWTSRLHGRVQREDVNLYVITIDTLRADAVGHLNPTLDTTPTLDRLAAAGLACEAAYVQSNESVPSHACMLTGRYPQSHGITRNGRELNRQQRPLADLLGSEGFTTAAYVNFGVLSWGTMTGHDFEKRRAVLNTPPRLDMADIEGNVFAGGLNWVRAVADQRHFLWLHSQFIHLEGVPEAYVRQYWPTVCPQGAAGRFDEVHARMSALGFRHVSLDYTAGKLDLTDAELAYWRAAYYGAVRYTDDHLAAFLDGLRQEGLDPYAAFVVASDHGMSLGEGRRLSHVGPPYEHLMHVPLVMVLPGSGLGPGRRVRTMVESVDIAPTVMAYLGYKVPRRMQGVDLTRALQTDEAYERDYVYAMIGRKGGRSYYGIRGTNWVYWTNFDEREFLGRSGSGEDFRSLDKEEPDIAAAMRARLMHWMRHTPDVSGSGDTELPEELRRLLEKAGYLESRE